MVYRILWIVLEDVLTVQLDICVGRIWQPLRIQYIFVCLAGICVRAGWIICERYLGILVISICPMFASLLQDHWMMLISGLERGRRGHRVHRVHCQAAH